MSRRALSTTRRRYKFQGPPYPRASDYVSVSIEAKKIYVEGNGDEKEACDRDGAASDSFGAAGVEVCER